MFAVVATRQGAFTASEVVRPSRREVKVEVIKFSGQQKGSSRRLRRGEVRMWEDRVGAAVKAFLRANSWQIVIVGLQAAIAAMIYLGVGQPAEVYAWNVSDEAENYARSAA